MRTKFIAHTKYPNTPETDLLDEVIHIVSYVENGIKKETEIMAKEPSDAIKKIMKGEIENELDRKIQTEKSSRCNRTE